MTNQIQNPKDQSSEMSEVRPPTKGCLLSTFYFLLFTNNQLPKTNNQLAEVRPPTGSKGFTLIEMIVALAIFSIVATVALGALVRVVSANRKAQSLQASVTNMNYALEAISREMRVGTSFYCNNSDSIDASYYNNTNNVLGDCAGGLSSGSDAVIAFRSTRLGASNCGVEKRNLITAYRFKKDGSLYLLQKAKQLDCTISISDTNFSPILDSNVVITDYYIKSGASDDAYPLMFIKMSGYVGVRELERTYFDVQTAVSSRTQTI